MTRDSRRNFLLVRGYSDALQDNRIRPMSDWGSSGRRFKSCQPDQRSEDVLLTMGRVAASRLVDLIDITTEDDVLEFTNSGLGNRLTVPLGVGGRHAVLPYVEDRPDSHRTYFDVSLAAPAQTRLLAIVGTCATIAMLRKSMPQILTLCWSVHARAGRGEKRFGSMRRAAIRKHSAPRKVPALASRASSVAPVFVMKAPTAEAPKAIEPIMLVHAASHSRDFS
jgi:hypothetical protein